MSEMVEAEINVFIDKGVGHVKLIVPAAPDTFAADGTVASWAQPDVARITALYNALVAALGEGHELGKEPPRQFGGGRPKERQKVTVAVDGVEREVTCPVCAGEVWDNRAKKQSGAFSAKAPDFACRNKECKGRVWSVADWIAEQEMSG